MATSLFNVVLVLGIFHLGDFYTYDLQWSTNEPRDIVVLRPATRMQALTNFSISFWLRTSEKVGEPTIAYIGDRNSVKYFRLQLQEYHHNSSSFQVNLLQHKTKFNIENVNVRDARWHHISFTWMGGNYPLGTIYVDYVHTAHHEIGKPDRLLPVELVVLARGVTERLDIADFFKGELTDFNLYDVCLEPWKVEELSMTCTSNDGNVFSWNDFRIGAQKGVKVHTPTTCPKYAFIRYNYDLQWTYQGRPDSKVWFHRGLPGPPRKLTEISISVWVRIDICHSFGQPTIISFARDIPLGASARKIQKERLADKREMEIRLQVGGYNSAVLVRLAGAKTDLVIKKGASAIMDGKFHHIGLTWSSADGSLDFYIDGKLTEYDYVLGKNKIDPRSPKYQVGESIATHSKVVENPNDFFIGQTLHGWESNDPTYFIGDMTDLNVYDRKLSPSAMLQLYQSCPANDGNLLQWSDVRVGIEGDMVIHPMTACVPDVPQRQVPDLRKRRAINIQKVHECSDPDELENSGLQWMQSKSIASLANHLSFLVLGTLTLLALL